jgi:hypothetical protein
VGSHNKKIDEWLTNTRAIQTSWCRFNSAPDQSLHRFAEQAPGDFWSFAGASPAGDGRAIGQGQCPSHVLKVAHGDTGSDRKCAKVRF